MSKWAEIRWVPHRISKKTPWIFAFSHVWLTTTTTTQRLIELWCCIYCKQLLFDADSMINHQWLLHFLFLFSSAGFWHFRSKYSHYCSLIRPTYIYVARRAACLFFFLFLLHDLWTLHCLSQCSISAVTMWKIFGSIAMKCSLKSS